MRQSAYSKDLVIKRKKAWLFCGKLSLVFICMYVAISLCLYYCIMPQCVKCLSVYICVSVLCLGALWDSLAWNASVCASAIVADQLLFGICMLCTYVQKLGNIKEQTDSPYTALLDRHVYMD